LINNRQNGRRRGRNGTQRPGGGGQGQRDNGNRIDSRARGNAPQLLEKYKNMARDAQMSGDRVNTEYYLQFADHYFRVLADQRGRSDDQQPMRRQRDDFDQFDDDEYGDEGEPIRAEDQSRVNEADSDNGQRRDGQGRDQNNREGQNRERQSRDNQNRGDQQGRGESQGRGNPSRDGQYRDGGNRDQQARDGNREPRRDFQREAPRDGHREARDLQAEREPQPRASGEEERPFQPSFAPANDAVDAPGGDEAAPRRRGRPRKVRDDAGGEGVAVAGLDADRLPPSIGAPMHDALSDAPAASGDQAEAPKPRRRRTRAAEATTLG
jgi:hypothetical protein